MKDKEKSRLWRSLALQGLSGEANGERAAALDIQPQKATGAASGDSSSRSRADWEQLVMIFCSGLSLSTR